LGIRQNRLTAQDIGQDVVDLSFVRLEDGVAPLAITGGTDERGLPNLAAEFLAGHHLTSCLGRCRLTALTRTRLRKVTSRRSNAVMASRLRETFSSER
jgi:hypothetical protein